MPTKVDYRLYKKTYNVHEKINYMAKYYLKHFAFTIEIVFISLMNWRWHYVYQKKIPPVNLLI